MKNKVDPAATRAAVVAVQDWIKHPDEVENQVGHCLPTPSVAPPAPSKPTRRGTRWNCGCPIRAAVQCIEGPSSCSRGTPPNVVVETDALTWLQLATGLLSWEGMPLAQLRWMPLARAQGNRCMAAHHSVSFSRPQRLGLQPW